MRAALACLALLASGCHIFGKPIPCNDDVNCPRDLTCVAGECAERVGPDRDDAGPLVDSGEREELTCRPLTAPDEDTGPGLVVRSSAASLLINGQPCPGDTGCFCDASPRTFVDVDVIDLRPEHYLRAVGVCTRGFPCAHALSDEPTRELVVDAAPISYDIALRVGSDGSSNEAIAVADVSVPASLPVLMNINGRVDVIGPEGATSQIGIDGIGNSQVALLTLDAAGAQVTGASWTRESLRIAERRGESFVVANDDRLVVFDASGTIDLGVNCALTLAPGENTVIARFDPAGVCAWAVAEPAAAPIELRGAHLTAGRLVVAWRRPASASPGAQDAGPDAGLDAGPAPAGSELVLRSYDVGLGTREAETSLFAGEYEGAPVAFATPPDAALGLCTSAPEGRFVALGPELAVLPATELRLPSSEGESRCTGLRFLGDDLVVAGVFRGNLSLPGAVGLSALGTTADAFVVRLNDDRSAPRWSLVLGGPEVAIENARLALRQGGPIIALQTNAAGGAVISAGPVSLTAQGLQDLVLAELEPSAGQLRWATLFGGADVERANGFVGVDRSLVAVGQYKSATTTVPHIQGGSIFLNDAFILRVTLP